MLKTDNLTIGYGGKVVLEGLSFTVPDGSCFLLKGSNGSGKTTLLRTLAGLQKPLSGAYDSSGRVMMVPSRIPRVKGFTVAEFVTTAQYGQMVSGTEVDEALDLVGIGMLSDRDITTLSDGEFQKACIATALAKRSDVILLDEPTSFLDVETKEMIVRTLVDVARSRDISVMFASHDVHIAEPLVDGVIDICQKVSHAL